tara:strand:+ start:113 stop:310 length:198 start_codon:yes stop_codon:yes gene_type:complete
MKMSNLTAEQVDALTHAWLDLSATNEMLNGDDPIDRRAWEEIAEATKDSVKEIETAFPFLLEIEV